MLMWCFCAICYHLYNLKSVKKTHGGVLLLVKLLKVTLLHGCFSRFLNCTNGTKSRRHHLCINNKYKNSWKIRYLISWYRLRTKSTQNTIHILQLILHIIFIVLESTFKNKFARLYNTSICKSLWEATCIIHNFHRDINIA